MRDGFRCVNHPYNPPSLLPSPVYPRSRATSRATTTAARASAVASARVSAAWSGRATPTTTATTASATGRRTRLPTSATGSSERESEQCHSSEHRGGVIIFSKSSPKPELWGGKRVNRDQIALSHELKTSAASERRTTRQR